MTEPSQKRAYQAGVAAAVLTSLLTVWTTIVRAMPFGWNPAENQPTMTVMLSMK